VQSVEPNGNADLAGVRPGDVLLTYDGRHLNSRADLTLRPADSPEKRVKVTLWRDGDVRDLSWPPGLGVQLETPSRPPKRCWLRSADSAKSSDARQARHGCRGARREVETIAGFFPGSDHVLWARRRTMRALRAGPIRGFEGLPVPPLRHTHGETNSAVALSSALILAPDPDRPTDPTSLGTDGRVTALQIAYTWELDAELVVLSACESGLGRYAGGEGYLGFAQALFIKGARSLVVSQWRVDDRSTALLMARFYQNLLGRRAGLRQPMPKAEALAEAKRWLRELTTDEAGAASSTPDRGVTRPLVTPSQSEPGGSLPAGPRTDGPRPYAHPYYWAAFIMVGDPGSGLP
jgi:CHAT domain-containing protein